MAEGQKLQWWQDEEVKQATEASERVAVAPKPLLPEASLTATEEETNAWAELEAEAAQRVEQAKAEEAELVSFFMPKLAALRRHRFWATCLQVSVGIVVILLSFFVYGQLTYLHKLNLSVLPITFFWSLVLTIPTWSLLCCKKQYQQLLHKESPVIRLAPQGVFIENPLRKEKFVAWSDVAGVKSCWLLKHRYLEIKTTNKHIITIDQQDLPVPVEAIVARIAAYRTALPTIP